MNCEKCNAQIPEDEQYHHAGKVLCEDCYIEFIEPPRTCDVTAVYSAKISRKMAGHVGTEGLTELQKDIYNFIKEEGPVTPDQILQKLKLEKWQLEKNFATLRHCELVSGYKENNQVYVKIWEKGSPGELKIEASK